MKRVSLKCANKVACRAELPLHLEPPQRPAEHRIPGDGAIGLERVSPEYTRPYHKTELCSSFTRKHTTVMATTRVAMTAQSSLRSVASRPICTPILSPMALIPCNLANITLQASPPPSDPSLSLPLPHKRRAHSPPPPEPSTGWRPKPANLANRAKAGLAAQLWYGATTASD
jgi:hypothetical protein